MKEHLTVYLIRFIWLNLKINNSETEQNGFPYTQRPLKRLCNVATNLTVRGFEKLPRILLLRRLKLGTLLKMACMGVVIKTNWIWTSSLPARKILINLRKS